MRDQAISHLMFEVVQIAVEVGVAGIEVEVAALSSETGTETFFLPAPEVDHARVGEIARSTEAGISVQRWTGTSGLNAESTIDHLTETFAPETMTFGRETTRQVAVVLGTGQPHLEHYRQ